MHLLSKLARNVAGCSRGRLLRLPTGPPSAAAVRAIHRDCLVVRRLLLGSRVPLQAALGRRLLHCSAALSFNGREPGHDGDKKGPNSPEDEEEDKHNKRLQVKALMWMVAACIIVMVPGLLFPPKQEGLQEMVTRFVTWNEFVYYMLATGEVDRVVVRLDSNTIIVQLKEGAVIKGKRAEKLLYRLNIMDAEAFEEKLREAELSLGLSGSQAVPVEFLRANDVAGSLLTLFLVVGLLVALVSLGSNVKFQKMDMFRQMTRAKFTAIDPDLPGSGRGVKFSDVAGAKEAKVEIKEFVDFLKNPMKYRALGAKSPKGALLLGPPGCGKTLLAKAVATEGEVPFLAMNGPEFIEVISGLGAARVRDLFKEAKKRSPCIIYIDEIDAIGRKRSGSGAGSEGAGEGEQTLNQLLVEMDGIGSKEGVVMLASTNRLDMLDKALLRPGRFDRHIILDLPTLEERQEILEHHMKGVVLEREPSFYSKRMAALTLGFSGAELANVVNEAALYAARNVRKQVTGEDLEYAVERVLGGVEKKSSSIMPEERRVIAYHEAGHALVGWMLEHTDALLKVTIVPRTSHALGFAQYHPTDRKLYTKDQLMERMCMALGGRAAESVVFNRITTGAQNDLDKVTKLAYAQVRNYGFSEAVGQVSFPQEEDNSLSRRPYSDRLSHLIDQEASKIIFAAYKKTEAIIMEHRHKLTMLAEELLEHETVTGVTLHKLWGAPPHGPKNTIDPLQFEGELNSWQGEGMVQKEEGN